MENLAKVFLGVGGLSLLTAIITNLTRNPLLGTRPGGFLDFAVTCAVFAIALMLLQKRSD